MGGRNSDFPWWGGGFWQGGCGMGVFMREKARDWVFFAKITFVYAAAG